jgi:cell division protein FtsB
MNVEPDNIVLRYLRRLDERTEDLQADLADLKMRARALEEQVTLMRSELALLRTDVIHIHHRLDILEDRQSGSNIVSA